MYRRQIIRIDVYTNILVKNIFKKYLNVDKKISSKKVFRTLFKYNYRKKYLYKNEGYRSVAYSDLNFGGGVYPQPPSTVSTPLVQVQRKKQNSNFFVI